jgi:hypothetical protein
LPKPVGTHKQTEAVGGREEDRAAEEVGGAPALARRRDPRAERKGATRADEGIAGKKRARPSGEPGSERLRLALRLLTMLAV